jgi:hypothetical protein
MKADQQVAGVYHQSARHTDFDPALAAVQDAPHMQTAVFGIEKLDKLKHGRTSAGFIPWAFIARSHGKPLIRKSNSRDSICGNAPVSALVGAL